MKILIIDDDEVFLDRLKRILTGDNHLITTAISGALALEFIDKENFDLILTDLKMPGISGIEVIQKVRQKGIDTIIIMITGYGTIESAVEAMKAGAYDYILKPFEIKSLKRKIEEVKSEIELRKEIDSKELTTKTGIGELDEIISIDGYKSPFLIISNDNPEKIIEKFNIKNSTSLTLSYEEKDDSINPSKLFNIKSIIEDFIREKKEGTIIFKGIEEIIKIFNWEIVKKFIVYLKTKLISSNFKLLILLVNGSTNLNKNEEKLTYDALSILRNPEIDKTIALLSHPIRNNIIKLLKSEKLNFNKIAKKLDIQKSSLLAFHMNKLELESTFEKDGNLYSLSPRGKYFLDLIKILENLGYTDPLSTVKIYKMTENNSDIEE